MSLALWEKTEVSWAPGQWASALRLQWPVVSNGPEFPPCSFKSLGYVCVTLTQAGGLSVPWFFLAVPISQYLSHLTCKGKMS